MARLFDERDTFVRLVLLDLSGIGYLVFAPHSLTPTRTQWALAVAAFVLILLLRWRPMVSLLVQTALLVTAFLVIDDPTINQVGASWALLELTMSAHRKAAVWTGTGLLSVVYLAFGAGWSWAEFGQAVFGLGVVVGLPALLGLNVRNSRALARQERERAAEELRRHESESRAARADERSAIARELHDVVAHHVASMVLRVGVARHVLPDLDPRVGEVFDDVHGTGTAALADLRRLVAILRDPDAVRGDAALTAIDPSALPAAIGAAVDRARSTGLTVEADVAASVATLDAVRGLAVLRLTQEALTNVAKHVGPSATARLAVSVEGDDLHWEVRDDGGDGGQPADRPVGGGHGLTGMRERVEVLGGTLTAGPSGTGWRLHTVLPAPNGAARDRPAGGRDRAGVSPGEPAP
jgi:signal transduction histidine kinase